MDHTDVGLRAVTKALTDVVAPAVSSEDPLASEQLRLAVEYVEFVRSRIDFFYHREQFELRHYLQMAGAVESIVAPSDAANLASLRTAIKNGKNIRRTCDSSLSTLKRTTAALAAAIATVVQASGGLEETVRRDLERCILNNSEAQIAFERAWYLPLGFDPAPNEAPRLEDFISR